MRFNDISKKIKKTAGRFGKFVTKYSPEILIGCGLVGFGTTCVLVAHEAPIAKEKLDELHIELGKSEEEITKTRVIFEEAKTVLPIYAPSIISGVVSCGCILGSYRISSKRTAAIATAYELANSSLIEYQRKVVEKLGEKKEAELRHEINEEKLQKNPPPEQLTNELVYTDDGCTLFTDFTGRYFRTNIDTARRAEKTISDRLKTEMYVPYNDFWWELGCGTKPIGDYLYFTVEKGIEMVFDYIKAPDGSSCTVIDFMNRPEAIDNGY